MERARRDREKGKHTRAGKVDDGEALANTLGEVHGAEEGLEVGLTGRGGVGEGGKEGLVGCLHKGVGEGNIQGHYK